MIHQQQRQLRERLRVAIDKHPLSQAQIAQRAEMPRQNLCDMLAGRKPVTLYRLIRVLAVLRPNLDLITAIIRAARL